MSKLLFNSLNKINMQSKVDTFDGWLKILTSDERWYETIQMHNKGKDFNKAANAVYLQVIADPFGFDHIPMVEHRKHVGNKLAKMPVSVVISVATHQPKIDDKPEHSEPILMGEARQKRIDEWLNAIKATENIMRVSRLMTLTKEQIEDEGKVREARKAIKYVPPTDEEIEMKNRINSVCVSMFKERKDYWNLHLFEIEGFKFMAENLEQARDIFMQATI